MLNAINNHIKFLIYILINMNNNYRISLRIEIPTTLLRYLFPINIDIYFLQIFRIISSPHEKTLENIVQYILWK